MGLSYFLDSPMLADASRKRKYHYTDKVLEALVLERVSRETGNSTVLWGLIANMTDDEQEAYFSVLGWRE